MKLYNLVPRGWSPSFIPELEAVAARLGTQPDYILAVIKHESGFDLRAKNPDGTAVGLIQWLESTLKGFGLTPANVLAMNEMQQLKLIEAYYNPGKKFGLNDPVKLFCWTFYPYACRPEIWSKPRWRFGEQVSLELARVIAKKNKSFDLNNNGYITIKEYKKYHAEYLNKLGIEYELPKESSGLKYVLIAAGALALYSLVKK